MRTRELGFPKDAGLELSLVGLLFIYQDNLNNEYSIKSRRYTNPMACKTYNL